MSRGRSIPYGLASSRYRTPFTTITTELILYDVTSAPLVSHQLTPSGTSHDYQLFSIPLECTIGRVMTFAHPPSRLKIKIPYLFSTRHYLHGFFTECLRMKINSVFSCTDIFRNGPSGISTSGHIPNSIQYRFYILFSSCPADHGPDRRMRFLYSFVRLRLDQFMCSTHTLNRSGADLSRECRERNYVRTTART